MKIISDKLSFEDNRIKSRNTKLNSILNKNPNSKIFTIKKANTENEFVILTAKSQENRYTATQSLPRDQAVGGRSRWYLRNSHHESFQGRDKFGGTH